MNGWIIGACIYVLFVFLWVGFRYHAGADKPPRSEWENQEEMAALAASTARSDEEKTPWLTIVLSLLLLGVGMWTFDHYFVTVLNVVQSVWSPHSLI